ncbi:MAG: PLD nuclease N-terminal domain-containing protein [Cyclobacteriaceae bacterium]
MLRIYAFLILFLDIVAIIDIVQGNKDTERKLLWILAVLFLPLFGPVLYYVIGKSKQ